MSDAWRTSSPRDNWRALIFVLTIGWRTDRAALSLSLIELVLAIGRGLVPLLLGIVVSAVVFARTGPLIGALAALAVVTGGSFLMSSFGARYRLRAMARVGLEVDERAVRTVARLPFARYAGESEALIAAVANGRGSAGTALNRLLNALRHASTPAALVLSSAIVEPRLLLVAILGLARLASNRFAEREAARAEGVAGRRLPAVNSYLDMCTRFDDGLEIRSYQAGGFVSGRLGRLVREVRDAHFRALWRSEAAGALVDSAYFLGAGAVVIWVAMDAVRGTTSTTALAVAVSCVVGLHASVWQLAGSLATLKTVFRGMVRIFRLDDLSSNVGGPVQTARTCSVEGRSAQAPIVELKDIDFRYDGSDEAVLHGLSCSIRPGETVAVVGHNGAGKTTLGLLLLGLLEPTSGLARRAGPNGDLTGAIQRTAVFQDFAKLEGNLRDSVTAGRAPVEDEAVRACLARAGALDVDRLVNSDLSRPIGSVFSDAVGLSGGQWQKVAVARAFHGSGSTLMVLDEHTSALDPIAEDGLLGGYLEEARRVGAAGGATVVITHRMALAAGCDKILVINGGAIVDEGSHAELVNRAGLYSQMYRQQAAGLLE